MTCGDFTWTPPVHKLEFAELKSGVKPGDKPQLRMTQMKALVKRFTARQEFLGNKGEFGLLSGSSGALPPNPRSLTRHDSGVQRVGLGRVAPKARRLWRTFDPAIPRGGALQQSSAAFRRTEFTVCGRQKQFKSVR
jgi:hypothetical protein